MNLENIEYNLSYRESIEELFLLIGQERIMEYYFESPVEIRTKYTNPFRQDKNPGAYFWYSSTRLYFIDRAITENLDAIDVAILRTSCTKSEIISRIKSDFDIEKSFTSSQDRQDAKLRNQLLFEKNAEAAARAATCIKVKLMAFTQSDIDYWNSQGSNPDTLNFYDVRRVKTAWINNEIFYINNSIDPCYRYKEMDKIKLYRPNCKNKKIKHRTNYSDEIIEGYTQLPASGTLLIITKSRKDVMTLSQLGYNAISSRGEGTPISENMFNILNARFDRIISWYDPDRAGRLGAEKLKKLYGIPTFYHCPVFGKDPSEIHQKSGKQILQQICTQLENASKQLSKQSY